MASSSWALQGKQAESAEIGSILTVLDKSGAGRGRVPKSINRGLCGIVLLSAVFQPRMVQDGALSTQDYKWVLNYVSIPLHPVSSSVTSILNSCHISPEPAEASGPFGLRKASFLSAYSGFQAQGEKTIFIVRGEG